ncbi:uncharacterized protein F5Z01DRAFT_672086 [Emericellopsis atlantica]|uniref:Uncharacterized protein n=1 Tax=Emericellopsis atlantica TaxID=2614577 RepID=A0A9P7ZR93_9HYPO|nr:uncharacterized protein F5Z01DRAFT_672086 [Emericellopsis atlantica]KAG9256854.1 hypothetical protein F5Z01DRAFT_672086 [Emericellopsis atlantica]
MSFQYPGVDYDLRYRVDELGVGRNNTHWQNIGRDSDRFHAIGVSTELAGCESPILQVREVAMMIFMNKITDKEGWEEKVFDDDIVAKWRQEAMTQSEEGLWKMICPGQRFEARHADKIHMPRVARLLSEETFNYGIAELRNKAAYFISSKLIPTLDAGHHTVVKSDNLVDDELHVMLAAAFDKLQRDALGKEDWHPGSDEMQQNLVHPSMYPLVWGRSKFLREEKVGVADAIAHIGQGETTPSQAEDPEAPKTKARRHAYSNYIGSGSISSGYWSEKYQWLPSLVDVKNGTPKIASYINGLHPQQHPEIYGAVEKLIDAVIPAWDQCLRGMSRYTVETPAGRTSTRFKQIGYADDDNESLWEPFDLDEWRDIQHEPSKDTLEELAEQFDLEDVRNDEAEWEGVRNGPRELTEDDKQLAKWLELRDPVYPEPAEFQTIDYEPQHASIRQRFAKHGLQIIVKMASAELTPEKPEFAGGNWHIEGQMNERICATALYYVDSENIEASTLSFRMPTSSYISDDMQAGQDSYHWLELVHGASLGASRGLAGSCLQTYGEIETRQGRVLAFPNVFQHKVSPFKLKDNTKPGHRRFVALWLVDPHHRILSTANVPPQQSSWWKQEAKEGEETSLPDGCMTLDEAKEHRLALMKERTARTNEMEERWVRTQYDFCEH